MISALASSTLRPHDTLATASGYKVMRGWFSIFREVELGRLLEISMLVKKAPNRRL
jgi:hypothetical protein